MDAGSRTAPLGFRRRFLSLLALPFLGVMLPGAGWGLEKLEKVEPRGTGGLLRPLEGSGPIEECASGRMPPLVCCSSCYLEGLAVWFNKWA